MSDRDVDHPPHYGGKNNDFEVIKVIHRMGKHVLVYFCVANAIKYVARARHKDGSQDLHKAVWYLDYAKNHVRDASAYMESLQDLSSQDYIEQAFRAWGLRNPLCRSALKALIEHRNIHLVADLMQDALDWECKNDSE